MQLIRPIRQFLKFPGDYCGEATPVTIPNTVVKLSRADDTAGVILWESRSLPGFSFLMKKAPGGEYPSLTPFSYHIELPSFSHHCYLFLTLLDVLLYTPASVSSSPPQCAFECNLVSKGGRALFATNFVTPEVP